MEANPDKIISLFFFLTSVDKAVKSRGRQLNLQAAEFVNDELHSQHSLKSCYLKKLCNLIIHYFKILL